MAEASTHHSEKHGAFPISFPERRAFLITNPRTQTAIRSIERLLIFRNLPHDCNDWLLDLDPAIRWQVLRDLVRASAETIAEERALTVTDGWGGRLLSFQGEDGQWAGGACFPAPSFHK